MQAGQSADLLVQLLCCTQTTKARCSYWQPMLEMLVLYWPERAKLCSSQQTMYLTCKPAMHIVTADAAEQLQCHSLMPLSCFLLVHSWTQCASICICRPSHNECSTTPGIFSCCWQSAAVAVLQIGHHVTNKEILKSIPCSAIPDTALHLKLYVGATALSRLICLQGRGAKAN